jgi:predicted PurR-regulated permease PerM
MANSRMDISWGSLWRIIAISTLVFVLYLTRETVSVLLLALVVSTSLDPAVDRLERWRIPRILGTIIIFLSGLVALAFMIYTIVPIFLLQLNTIFKDLTGLTNQFLGMGSPSQVMEFMNIDINRLTSVLLSGKVPFLQVLGNLLGGAAFAIAVVVLSFYLTISRDGIEKFIKSILPEGVEKRALELYRRTRRKIGKWFQAQIILSLVVGTLVFAGLWILGVEQSLVIAVIAAVFELVPIVGPIFAGALAVIVGLGESLKLGLYILVLFLIIHQIENHILVPLVMKRAIGVNPVIILIALLGGAQIAGIIGMLIAIPTVVFLQELLNDWVVVKTRRSRGKLKV